MGVAFIDFCIFFFFCRSPGRHQAAVCELEGFMYVAGGAESWNCLNSVERYNPDNNTWTLVAPMNVARRGAGIAVHAGEPDCRGAERCFFFFLLGRFLQPI